MEWTGEGLIIGTRRHGESGVIVEAMVRGRGRHLGLVRGGRSRKQAATLQQGNSVQLTWRARLEEHLGLYTVEMTRARAAILIADQTHLYTAELLCAHLRLLPERDPHDMLLEMAIAILDSDATGSELGEAVARFELSLLDELGFGLDLTACAATGERNNLTHVSPKSGRAVSAGAAAPYAGRLLELPRFLVADTDATRADIAAGFAMTGHFLDMHVWQPRGLAQPTVRDRLIALLTEPV